MDPRPLVIRSIGFAGNMLCTKALAMFGVVAERLNAPVLKTGGPVRVS